MTCPNAGMSACGQTSIGITVVPSGHQWRRALSGKPCHAWAPFVWRRSTFFRSAAPGSSVAPQLWQPPCSMLNVHANRGTRSIYESENRNERRQTLSACPRSRHLVACLTKLQPSGTASPVGSCWGLRNWSKGTGGSQRFIGGQECLKSALYPASYAARQLVSPAARGEDRESAPPSCLK